MLCNITVSYTHLRAHETSQDLVCRLLLEKKNCDERMNTERTDGQTDRRDKQNSAVDLAQ